MKDIVSLFKKKFFKSTILRINYGCNHAFWKKFKGNSVKEIVLKDYDYFMWVHKKVEKRDVRERFDYVDYVVNNFVSQINCAVDGCNVPARGISIYSGAGQRVSSIDYVYCSRACYQKDGKVEMSKSTVVPLRFSSALGKVKCDTNNLVEIIARCMGIKEGKKTKEYLEEFFDKVSLVKPYQTK